MTKEEIEKLLDKLDLDEWCTDLYKVPLTWCELYDIRDYINSLQQENKQLKEKIKWKPIDEYFENKQKYDWVLVKYYDKYNFECIPSVAEYRFGKWYLKDNEKTLGDFEIKYFFDMQELENGDSNE